MKQTHKNAELTTGKNWVLNPTGIMENAILHSVLIDNNQGDYDLEVALNGSADKVFLIPAGAGREIYGETFNWLKITNKGAGTIAANNIYVTLSDEISIIEGGGF